MEEICSWLSTEQGPQISATFSSPPIFTPPIATGEAAPRNSYEASLYGFSIGTIASTPGMAASGFSRIRSSAPITPMMTREAPRLICASSPNSRTRATTRSIWSSVAFGWVMIIMAGRTGTR